MNLSDKIHYPNNLSGPDWNNNTERVIIEGVNGGDVATITVTGYDLARKSQYYSLVATGCFGGVANQNFIEECSAFDCDDSVSDRKAKVYMVIFIPLGFVLLSMGGSFFMRRRRKKQLGGYNLADDQYADQ